MSTTKAGGRNIELTRVAGAMRAQGKDAREIEEALLVHPERRGLPIREIRVIAKSIGAKPAGTPRLEPEALAELDPLIEFAQRRGWTAEALRAFGAESDIAKRHVRIPMRADAAVVGWRIRQANNARFQNGEKALTNRGGKMGLVHPEPLPAEGPVIVTESEADAFACHAAGHGAVVATSGAKPGKTARAELPRLLHGRDVVLSPHADPAGEEWRELVGGILRGAQCNIRILPPEPDLDLDERLQREDSKASALAAWIKNAIPWRPYQKKNPTEPSSGLPQIQTNDRQRRHIFADTWDVIKKANNRPFLFQRSGTLVTKKDVSTKHQVKHQVYILEEADIYGMLTRIADWVRVIESKHGETIKADFPPKDVVKDILCNPDHSIPPLESVISTPVFGESGDLIITPGYHKEDACILEDSGLRIYEVPNEPTPKNIEWARNQLLETICDFPFVTETDRAHTVAAMLLPFVRRMISGPTPMHLITSPTPGSGKSLIAAIVQMITTGDSSEARAFPEREEERQKFLFSELLTSPSVILLDNASQRRTLDSSTLAMALTSVAWTDRLLGGNRHVTVTNQALWLMTANNPTLSMELARRCIRIRIDPKRDQPWLRTGFRHPQPIEFTKINRSNLVTSCLTLIRAWMAAGQPAGKAKLGSFERWATVIGGILQVAGIDGFLGNLQALYEEADNEGSMWRTFVKAWWEEFGGRRVKPSVLVDFARRNGLADAILGDSENARALQIRMGKALSKNADRCFGDFTIKRLHDRLGVVFFLGRHSSADGDIQHDIQHDIQRHQDQQPELFAGSAEYAERNGTEACAPASARVCAHDSLPQNIQHIQHLPQNIDNTGLLPAELAAEYRTTSSASVVRGEV